MSDRVRELYERGSELFEKDNYIEAEGLLREVLKYKRYADVLNKLGLIAHNNGDLEEAAEFFGQAIEVNPRYTEAYLNLVITYNDLGQTERAAELFEEMKRKALTAAPRGIDPFVAGKLANEHLRVGNMYLDYGCWDDAIEEFRKALKLKPGLPDVLTRLGIALRERGLYDEAVSAFTRARQVNPGYGPARVQLGLTYHMQGFTGLAFEEWQKALQEIPDLKEAAMFLDLFGEGRPGAAS